MASLEGRMDRIDGRMDAIERRMDRMEGHLDRIDGRMERLGERLDTGVQGLRSEMHTNFRWIVGLLFTTWVSTIAALVAFATAIIVRLP